MMGIWELHTLGPSVHVATTRFSSLAEFPFNEDTSTTSYIVNWTVLGVEQILGIHAAGRSGSPTSVSQA